MITYTPKRFRAASLAIIGQVNAIDAEYRQQRFDLSLRQVFYKYVARGYLPNTERSYKRLGDIVADARLAGLIDWEAITDRTRYVRSVAHWDEPGDIMHAAARPASGWISGRRSAIGPRYGSRRMRSWA